MRWIPIRLCAGLCLLALNLTTALAQDNAADRPAAQRTAFSGAFIPPDAAVAGFVSPRAIMTAPELRMMPVEIIQAQAIAETGVDPLHIEQVTFVAGLPGPNGPPAAVIIQFTQDYAISDLNPRLLLDTEPLQMDDREVYPLEGPPGTVLHRRDGRTWILATGGYLEDVLTAAETQGQLSKLVTRVPNQGGVTVVSVMEPVRPMITGMLKQDADQMPPALRDLTDFAEWTDALVVNVQPRGLLDMQVMAVALCTDEAAASNLEAALNGALDFGRDEFRRQMGRDVDPEDPIQLATLKYYARISQQFSDALRPQRTGNRVTLRAGGKMASSGVLIGVLLPAVQAARTAARRVVVANDLKNLALAMHNHHDAYARLPSPITAEDGTPLLSWRVKILPFIEQHALYEQFHLDEPWDSEHNLALLEQMPDIYAHPRLNLPAGQTVYQVPVGERTMFPAGEPLHFRDITDGLSNTLMIVEASEAAAVPWTKPADVQIDMENPAANLSQRRADGFQAARGDGAVLTIPREDKEKLKALFTRDDGKIIDF
ncbi:DUF1559 family PulG-like putative transporter [Roseimaritima sediminicola]|uniref:DUF1559 family PulG-like putative transporter n=1 Tax=Roseimaritima sediminicola TaxID=2662066 RepID=UPI0012982537|nr:DUF1559 domain-containing protein [Roseimaritima sediminicola]